MGNFFDKLMESKWSVRGIALVLALLLYATAYIDENNPFPTSATATDRTERIEDVPVVLMYDEKSLIVTGAPETVDVIVSGNSSIVKRTKSLKDFTVYLDLRNAKIGKQRVKFQVRDISDKLSVRVDPESVEINVQEKVTKEYKVEVQFNQSLLEEGYVLEEPEVEPDTVTITGPKDVVDRISYVYANIERKQKVNRTFTQKVPVSVLDQNLNKLDVIVEPAEVSVTIPVKSPEKTVPVIIRQEGSPKEGVTISNIEPSVREVTVYGRKSVLDDISNIEIPVNVSKVEEDEEIEVPVPLKDGIHASNPETITVKITVVKSPEKEETKTINNVPVRHVGLNDQFTLDFIDPEDGRVDVRVSGASNRLSRIRADDFNFAVNVGGLKDGEYELDIQMSGPNDVNWSPSRKSVKMRITAKARQDEQTDRQDL